MVKNVNGRVIMVDIGCGPATCGIVFAELLHAQLSNVRYVGIDVSIAMKNMAQKLLGDVTEGRMGMSFKSSFHELDDSFWESVSEVPNLVIFNMSYFFSNVDSTFTENLANRIINVMKANPRNRYVFVIQHSEHDSRIRSFVVFKRLLGQYTVTIKLEHSNFSYILSGMSRTIPFCYEIWSV